MTSSVTDVIGAFISNSVSIGGDSGDNLPHEQIINGVSVRYGDVVNGSRQVNVDGRVSLGIGPYTSGTSQIDSLVVRNEDGRLWVNDVEVDLVHGEDPRVAAAHAAERAKALAAIGARYPGVHFIGELRLGQIGSKVQIAPGATIDVRHGVRLGDSLRVGPHANITDGVINGGVVNGEVDGGVLNGSVVEEGARVDGGVLNGATVRAGARVRGGVINGGEIAPGD